MSRQVEQRSAVTPAGEEAVAPAPARPSRIRRFRGLIGAAVLLVALLAAGELLVAMGAINEIILPRPSNVATAFVQTLGESFFYRHLWVTTFEVLVGFGVGTAIGFVIGAILGTSRLAREIAYPYVIAFQGLPKVVLAPVFITAFGFGVVSKIAMAVAISFFPILINTMAGLTSVDPDAIRLMRSFNASRWHIFTKLALPHSLPMVFAGLKTGLTLALVGAIVGEFVGASEGLGYLLGVYSYQLQVPRVWAVTLVLALLGVILFLTIEWIDRKLIFWQSKREISATA